MNRGYGTTLVWIVLAIGLAGPAFAQDAERGRALYELCATCHGEQGEGNALYLAPSIGGLPSWYVEQQLEKFRAGGRGMHFDDIPGMRMRPMALTLRNDRGDDLRDVTAYVASLPVTKPPPLLTGGDAARGAGFYAVCQACHGPAGEGVAATNGPPLANQNDWYLLSSLERFKSGVRGSSPNDPNGAVMRGMAAVLPDEQAIQDVIAYIISLPGK